MPFPSTLFRLTQHQLDSVPSQQLITALDQLEAQLEQALLQGDDRPVPLLIAQVSFLEDQYERFGDSLDEQGLLRGTGDEVEESAPLYPEPPSLEELEEIDRIERARQLPEPDELDVIIVDMEPLVE